MTKRKYKKCIKMGSYSGYTQTLEPLEKLFK